ncbi:MAG: acylphosphatase [Sphingobium sp.]
MIARRIRVRGRVQGVFFRDWTAGEARALGITGWVRNRTGGSVEILAQGEVEAVEALVAKLHLGSPASRVDALTVDEVEFAGLEGFERRPTE